MLLLRRWIPAKARMTMQMTMQMSTRGAGRMAQRHPGTVVRRARSLAAETMTTGLNAGRERLAR
jgi:hypothetical protein